MITCRPSSARAGTRAARVADSPGKDEPAPGPHERPDRGCPSETREQPATRESNVIIVWSPAGSAGRTTCAVHLANALSADDSTLLVEADTVAPVCGPMLGLLDEAPGILAAARLIDAGTFNLRQLRDLVTAVGEEFDVLTALGRASRWHELTRWHVQSILAQARES